MTSKIKRMPLQYEIITYIQDYIQDHELKAGDRLPSQAEMIEMMGVSRTALREAIKTLEAKEVLEVRNGRGVYVKENFADALSNQVNFTKEKETMIELLEVRRALEREMIRMIVERSTEEELDELGSIVKVLMEKYYRGERQNKEDKQFHDKLYEMSHHKTIQQLIQFLSENMSKFWEFPLDMKDPFTNTIPLHEDLYHALRERDIKKARQINTKILNMEIKEIEQV